MPVRARPGPRALGQGPRAGPSGQARGAGPQAQDCLQRICANNVDVAIGKIVYTQWLNESGGIEADVTITRLATDRFMIVSACVSERRDWFWLSKHAAQFDCEVSQDQETAIIGAMGPKSTRLLGAICDDPDRAERIDYYASALLTAGDIAFRANRLSYVGERGFELYLPSHRATELWQRLLRAGAPLNVRAAGFHAMNACRMEKGYRHWGDDIHDHITPLQAGLGFAAAAPEPRELPLTKIGITWNY